MLTKFRHSEKVILKATKSEAVIDKVEKNFGNGTVKYILENGDSVTDKDLLKLSQVKNAEKPKKETKKKQKKDFVSPVEKVDQPSENKDIEKNDSETKK